MGPDDNHVPIVMEAHGWLCEMSLWMAWFNRGKAVADHSEGAHLVELDSSLFANIVKHRGTSLYYCQQYAKGYVSKIHEAISKRGLSCLTDLYGEEEDIRELAATSFTPPQHGISKLYSFTRSLSQC
eukprot:gnl/TRDRNA2_/TRDRNA2_96171_c1_seq1.p1 gnl/TRDRNA2_/TRDRNA2_96171_c1~~gnl/TRDRNA2_/TRDRNA2_96171_c1_seq1.p1  ORF type:complete len:148 (-),score=9.69 gnl/TRDRNA2_/TRDRNA2_96171_c1_seq1:56-436(-)